MSQFETDQLCRLQAVSRTGAEDLPAAVVQAFEIAGQQMERPGAFESLAIAVSGEAFQSLTGFSPDQGEFIAPEAVRRGAEAATPARTKALGNARRLLRNDYIALGVFLRVCALHGLGLKTSFIAATRNRR